MRNIFYTQFRILVFWVWCFRFCHSRFSVSGFIVPHFMFQHSVFRPSWFYYVPLRDWVFRVLLFWIYCSSVRDLVFQFSAFLVLLPFLPNMCIHSVSLKKKLYTISLLSKYYLILLREVKLLKYTCNVTPHVVKQ